MGTPMQMPVHVSNCLTWYSWFCLSSIKKNPNYSTVYLSVELVLFCQPSDLQLSLYKQLLSSRTVRSCISCTDTAAHLTCISALKKLCNHPALLFARAGEDSENTDTGQLEVG